MKHNETLLNSRDYWQKKAETLINEKAKLLEALKAVRRHGLIEKDGYGTVVKLMGEAIKNAES